MENEDLMKMIQIYKTKLADADEKIIAMQVMLSNDMKIKDDMRVTIENLETQIKELTTSEE